MHIIPLSYLDNSNFAPRIKRAQNLAVNNLSYPTDSFTFTGKKKNTKIEDDDEYFIKRFVKTLNMKKILSLPVTKRVEKPKPKSFEDSDKKYSLDPYQKQAIESFKSGNTTIVTAPTGTGKTLIAEYAIDDALKKNKKILYLSPLKALSNEKFVKFSELFGEYDQDGNFLNSDNVGLITGDTVIHPDANLLVMTTEIYRNALLSDNNNGIKAALDNIDGIIYDEFHYLGDKQRGTVWEEAVTETPKHIKQMMLSATASNADEVENWVKFLNPAIETSLVSVPESERHVPLQHFVFGYDKKGRPTIIPTQKQKIIIDKAFEDSKTSERKQIALCDLEEFLETTNDLPVKDFLYTISSGNDILKAETLESKLTAKGMSKEKSREISLVLAEPELLTYATEPKLGFNGDDDMTFLIDILQEKEMNPALIYIFSKQGCENAFIDAVNYNGTLLTSKQSRKVLDYVNEAKEKGIYLGADFDKKYLKGLLSGYAVHHAGMLPAYKSLVEGLAREGLIKVCFATETLIAGINMPFRTSVFTSFEKPTEESRHTPISPALFAQGAGRAGRRGKDLVGNVIVMPRSLDQYQDYYLELAKTKNREIDSQFFLSYNSLLQDKYLNSTTDSLENTFAVSKDPKSFKELKEEADNIFKYLYIKGYIDSDSGNKIKPTQKGEIAKNIWGINEVFMTELVWDPKYTENLEPEDLIALMATFADIKDENPSRQIRETKYQDLNTKIQPAIQLAEEINKEQKCYGIINSIDFSTNLVPAIYEFAISKPENSIETWNKTMESMKFAGIIKHEGDYLRVINGTIDLLRTLKTATNDKTLKLKVDCAIEMLQKSPVTDISSYELKP